MNKLSPIMYAFWTEEGHAVTKMFGVLCHFSVNIWFYLAFGFLEIVHIYFNNIIYKLIQYDIKFKVKRTKHMYN